MRSRRGRRFPRRLLVLARHCRLPCCSSSLARRQILDKQPSSRRQRLKIPKTHCKPAARPFVAQWHHSQSKGRPERLGNLTRHDSQPQTRYTTPFDGGLVPGTACIDAPVRSQGADTWLLPHLGNAMVLVVYGDLDTEASATLKRVRRTPPDLRIISILPDSAPARGPNYDDMVALHDSTVLVQFRYALQPGSEYLIRPDQHVCPMAGPRRRCRGGIDPPCVGTRVCETQPRLVVSSKKPIAYSRAA